MLICMCECLYTWWRYMLVPLYSCAGQRTTPENGSPYCPGCSGVELSTLELVKVASSTEPSQLPKYLLRQHLPALYITLLGCL